LTQNIIIGSLCTFKIGIGINVNNKITNTNFRSTSLSSILGKKINLLDLSGSLQKYLNSSIFNEFNNLSISNYLNKNLIKNSTSYSHHFNNSITEHVKVLSLNKDFSLKIRQDNLIKNISYGEIR
jgi:biotin-(acetyl-CoA carboxylase) ligase